MAAISAGTMVRDSNGETAALIKVRTTEKGLVFEGGMLGIVKQVQQIGEVWVYVPSGIKRITVKHPTLGVLPDYEIPDSVPIEAARTYIMVLKSRDTRQGGLELVFTPATAHVAVDGEDWTGSTFNGNLRTRLSYGQHTYEISAEGYESQRGTFVMDSSTVNLRVDLVELPSLMQDSTIAPQGTVTTAMVETLLPDSTIFTSSNYSVQRDSFVTMTHSAKLANVVLSSPFEDTDIYLNGIYKGTGQWCGVLPYGIYLVELQRMNRKNVALVNFTEKERQSILIDSLTLSSNPIISHAPESVIMTQNISDSISSLSIERMQNALKAYKQRKYKEAMEGFYFLASYNYPMALHYLGECFFYGKGVYKDREKAVTWYKKAASVGCLEAQYKLGRLYETGKGIVKNKEKSILWYKKAAERGQPDAQCRIGDYYYSLENMPQNRKEAMKWYYKAAEQRHGEAIYKSENM